MNFPEGGDNLIFQEDKTMTMQYLKKLPMEDALKILSDKLDDALKNIERETLLGPDALLELDGLAALCRTYALYAAQKELDALDEAGPICGIAGALHTAAEAIEDYLDDSMDETYPDACEYMVELMEREDAKRTLVELEMALREDGKLQDNEALFIVIKDEDEEPELTEDRRLILLDENDDNELICLADIAEEALIAAGIMNDDQDMYIVAGPADEDEDDEDDPGITGWDEGDESWDGDDEEDTDGILQALDAVQAGLDSLAEEIHEAGLLEEGENLQLTILSPGEDLEIDEGQRLICYDEKVGDRVEALKDILVEAGLIKGDCEIALLAGPGCGCEDCDEDEPEIELLDMADLEDGEAEAVKAMADMLVAAGMMHPDQDICIAKVGVTPAEDGRPYASLYIGDDTTLMVTPG